MVGIYVTYGMVIYFPDLKLALSRVAYFWGVLPVRAIYGVVCGCSGSMVGWLIWYGKSQYRGTTADHRTGNDRTIVTERIVRCKHAKPGDKSRCRLDHQTVNCLPYSSPIQLWP